MPGIARRTCHSEHLHAPLRSGVDEATFRRILFHNIGLLLGTGIVTAVAFVALVLYLLSGIDWVEHSERVIGNTQTGDNTQ